MSASPAPVTLITGASLGLGRSAATHLVRAGHDLILTYHRQTGAAEAVAAELRGLGRRVAVLPLDVGEVGGFPAFAAQVREVLAGWGLARFDHLVNNAGTGLHVPFAETTAEQLDAMYRIHFKGPYLLSQALLPLIAAAAASSTCPAAWPASACPARPPTRR